MHAYDTIMDTLAAIMSCDDGRLNELLLSVQMLETKSNICPFATVDPRQKQRRQGLWRDRVRDAHHTSETQRVTTAAELQHVHLPRQSSMIMLESSSWHGSLGHGSNLDRGPPTTGIARRRC